jgi:hypothetical protein
MGRPAAGRQPPQIIIINTHIITPQRQFLCGFRTQNKKNNFILLLQQRAQRLTKKRDKHEIM